MTVPGIHELDYRYIDDDWKTAPLSWSRKRQDSGGTKSSKAGGDSRTGRSSDPVWQSPADEAAAAEVNWDEQCLSCIGLPAAT